MVFFKSARTVKSMEQRHESLVKLMCPRIPTRYSNQYLHILDTAL